MNSKKYFIFTVLICLINIGMQQISHAIEVDRPDYFILSVTPDRLTQVQGGSIIFTAVIKNDGKATMRSSDLVWESCDTKPCNYASTNWKINETDTIPGLGYKEESVATYSHEMPFGEIFFRVRCDYVDGNANGAIFEEYESTDTANYNPYTDNNILQPPIEITTPYPDLQIAEDKDKNPRIWWAPEFPIAGQEVTFYADITNIGYGGSVDDFEVEFIVYLEDDPKNPISLGSEKYNGGIPLGPSSFCTVASKKTWPAVSGQHKIEAYVNEKQSVDENKATDNNKSEITMSTIDYPNLEINNVWWLPQNPQEGEEVTFYASIMNLGKGGTIQEYDVDFTVTEHAPDDYQIAETQLKTATIKDHVLPANGKPIPSGNFEFDYLNSDWPFVTGSVSIEKHGFGKTTDWIMNACYDNIGDIQLNPDPSCKTCLIDYCTGVAQSNPACLTCLYFDYRYVQLSGAYSILRSEAFAITGSEASSITANTLVFRAKGSGSGTRLLSLCKPDTNCQGSNQLLSQEIAQSKDSWQAYILDITQIKEKYEKIVIELNTGTSSNSLLMVDDIRLTDNTKSQIFVALPSSDAWEAKPGNYKITARLSANNTIEDPDETHTQEMEKFLRRDIDDPVIMHPDYKIIKVIASPEKQLIGNTITYTAEIVNESTAGGTLLDAELNWYEKNVQNNSYGKSLETDKITGLKAGESISHTFEMSVTSDDIFVSACIGTIKDGSCVNELLNEIDLSDNLWDHVGIPVDDVDLEVKNVWWLVEDPNPGQDPTVPIEGQKVRFYARIDNIAEGGAVTDFDVQFIVDEGKSDEADLKNTTVKDDILFARYGSNINGDFEGNGQWTILKGGFSVDSYCAADDSNCTIENYGNLNYARLYGASTTLRSNSFFINSPSGIIEFKAQVTGSGTKNFKLLCINGSYCTDPPNEKVLTIDGKSTWNAYVMDVKDWGGHEVQIELSTEGSGNMEFWVDDIRMEEDTNDAVVVAIVASKDTWEATTGYHDVSVIADVNNTIKELDDYDSASPTASSNNYWRGDEHLGFEVSTPDYEMLTVISRTTSQIQGRDVQVAATLRMNNSGTSLETDLNWYTCLDPDPSDTAYPCPDPDSDPNWKNIYGAAATKETVPAMQINDVFTSVFTYTAEYGVMHVIAEVNPDKTVNEGINVQYDNNVKICKNPFEVKKPKLKANSVWWLPQNPKDGEEVTFYAEIVNDYRFGGTVTDFEVSFQVINKDTNKVDDLGTTKLKDDILIAERRGIFSNGCFATSSGAETDKLLNKWEKKSGSMSIVDRCDGYGDQCDVMNRYYVRLYGANTVLQSDTFELDSQGVIEFSGFTNGSGTKKLIVVKVRDDGTLEEEEFPFTEKQPWRANLINISNADQVYLKLLTEGASNAEFFVDDFRMSVPNPDDAYVAIATSKKVWTAQPGPFAISVAVNLENTTSEGLQSDLVSAGSDSDQLIENANYKVVLFELEQEDQIIGKDIQATAVIKNLSGSTLIESESQWTINGKTTKEKIPGLSENETYTSTITFAVIAGDNTVHFKCDATGVIDEHDEGDNEQEQTINIKSPSLEVGEIWWSPENPNDGQEVTFFTRIDNIGLGGSSDDIEVRFVVIKNGIETEISKEKITTDAPFAMGKAPFPNSDFSGSVFDCGGTSTGDDPIEGWDTYGNVFSESRCTVNDNACPDQIASVITATTPHSQFGNETYARLYGESNIQRQFEASTGYRYLQFKAATSGSGNKKVQILDSNKEIVLLDELITSKSWEAHVFTINTIDFNNDKRYFKAITEGSDNAELMIDDIRVIKTYESEEKCRIMVDTVQSSKTWVAQPGEIKIRVEIVGAPEVDGVSKGSRSEPITSVELADYAITLDDGTPKRQIKGRTVKYMATLENIGASTYVESELSWLTCNGTKDCSDDGNWTEDQTDTVAALANNGVYTSTFILTLDYGNNHVRVKCDSGNVIAEKDDTDNNVDQKEYPEVEKPDLRISKVGYLPQNPVDGESMTFFAQIENIGSGGTNEEVDLTFKITDDYGVETTIEAEKSSNEIMFANHSVITFAETNDPQSQIYTNSDFENGTLINWTTKGSIFLEKVDWGYKEIGREDDAVDDNYYVRIYGDGSTLRSDPFYILESQSIVFKGQTSGSGIKKAVLKNDQNDEILITQEFTESSPWRVFIMDVSKLLDKKVRLEFTTSGAANSEFWVDDIRMYKNIQPVADTYVYVSTVQSKKGWIAIPGMHTVVAEVDSSNAVFEQDENNNILEAPLNLKSIAADYTITSIEFTPAEQIRGKEIVFTAHLKNIGSATQIESELEWSYCQGDATYCQYNPWTSGSKEKISGLAEGGEYTSVYNMEVVYDSSGKSDEDSYLLQVKVACDINNDIIENYISLNNAKEEQNTVNINDIKIYHPDLKVGKVWWTPETPVDGDEVTFFARIDNVGPGGTNESFEVNFMMNAGSGDAEEDLGSTKVETETPFGWTKPIDFIYDNPIDFDYSFECGLPPWKVMSGSVFWDSKCLDTDADCKVTKCYQTYDCSDTDCRYIDTRYARVYGENAVLRSLEFTINEDSLFFRGQTSGSGTKKLLIIDATSKNALIEKSYSEKSPWKAYVIDVREKDDKEKGIDNSIMGKKVYIEVRTEGASNAEFMVDDFRMGSYPNAVPNNNETAVVSYITSSKTWIAKPDNLPDLHTIQITVDSKQAIQEVGETTKNEKNITTCELNSIERANYIVKIDDALTTPKQQIQGRNIDLTAVIENIGATTKLASELQWFTCQDPDNIDVCQIGTDYESYWTKQQTEKLEVGIPENGTYTVTYSMIVPTIQVQDTATDTTGNSEGYTIFVKAKADINGAILEANDEETNAVITTVQVGHPDLIIKEESDNIYWIPEDPIDGEEVIFYAQIQNQGSGGTVQDYEVNFYVDKGEKTEEDLGSVKMQDDILFGYHLPITSEPLGITIGDFENKNIELAEANSNSISCWERSNGEVYIANHFEGTSLSKGTDRFKYDRLDNKQYLVVSGGSALAKSPPFVLSGDELIFRAQTNGSGDKTLRIKPVVNTNEDPPALYEKTYNDKSPWRAYLIDISQWDGVLARIEIENVGTGNMSFMVDDFRMKVTEDKEAGAVNVGTAISSKKWLARDDAKLTVVVDAKESIYEVSRENTYVFSRSIPLSSQALTRKITDSWWWKPDRLRDGERNNIREAIIDLLEDLPSNFGDIDSNGQIEIKDIIIAAQIMTKFDMSTINISYIDLDAVDVDNNAQIGLAEMIYLIISLSEQ